MTEAMEAATDPGRARRAFPLSGRRHQRAAGERIAALFEEHGRMVYGVCRLILRDAVEAEDAAQQTFLSAYRALLGGQEPRDPSAWLGTIARNECRSRLRSRRAEPVRLIREPVGDELQRDVGRREEIQALCSALAELPPQQRDVIVLREFYGLSYAEVGAALGLTGPAVESLIFRSRKRLQEQLRPVRSALGMLTLPMTLRESLAQALPGFGGGGASAGAGAATLAKLASTPVAAKVAAVTLAVGGAGTVASLETSHVVRHRAAVRHAAAASAPIAPAALVAPTPVAFATSAPVASRTQAVSAPVQSKASAPAPTREPAETERSSGGEQESRSGTTGERRSGGGEVSRQEPSHESSRQEPSHESSGSHEGSPGAVEPSHEGPTGGEDPSHQTESSGEEPSHDGSGGSGA